MTAQPAPLPSPSPSASACEPYRDAIELALSQGRNAKAVWQDLVDHHSFSGSYRSVKRFVPELQATRPPEAGPMGRDPNAGKHRRTRLFVLTLGYSRKSVRLLTFSGIWLAHKVTLLQLP